LYRSDLIQFKEGEKFYFKDHGDDDLHWRCSECDQLVISKRESEKQGQQKLPVKLKDKLFGLLKNII
jgi:hypothetical protein